MLNLLMFIGVSHLCIVEEYNHEVGDFCGKAITAQAENFTLENYVLNLKMTTKPRLYLLSKKKVQEQEVKPIKKQFFFLELTPPPQVID